MARSRPFPLYPRKPHASGQARIRYKGDDHYLGRFGSAESKKEYARLRLELAAAPGEAKPSPAPHAAMTCLEVATAYLEHLTAERGEGWGELASFRAALKVLCEVHGETPAVNFRAGQLDDVRAKMLKAWCRNVTNRQIVRLRTCFRWAEQRGYVPEGRWHHLRSLPSLRGRPGVRDTHPKTPASRAQLDAAMPQAAPAVAAMLELQWLTGMRPSEVVRMRACDVDDAGEVWHYRLGSDKNSWRGQDYVGDVVPLGPACREVLAPWLAAARRQGAETYLFQPSRRRRHKHYTEASYNRAVARACKAAGCEHFSPYQLRHAAKERIEAELGPAAASAVLRHRSIETTRRYARRQNRELADRAARQVG